jgi:hypothetical protein
LITRHTAHSPTAQVDRLAAHVLQRHRLGDLINSDDP